MKGELVVDPELALAAVSEGSIPLTLRERDVFSASPFGANLAEIATAVSVGVNGSLSSVDGDAETGCPESYGGGTVRRTERLALSR